MRPCQCPNCNAQISLDDSRDFGFCQYCGTKIMLDDYRSTHRIVDEARIRETETDRIIRLRELELEEKENARSRKGRMVAYIIALVFVIAGLISCAIGGANMVGIYLIIGGALIAEFTMLGSSNQKKKREDARKARSGMIKLTSAATEYKEKNYRNIEAIYSRLGFRNVSSINMYDLRVGLLKKPGTVEEVTIDGEEPEEDEWYNPNAEVIITYHGLAL